MNEEEEKRKAISDINWELSKFNRKFNGEYIYNLQKKNADLHKQLAETKKENIFLLQDEGLFERLLREITPAKTGMTLYGRLCEFQEKYYEVLRKLKEAREEIRKLSSKVGPFN